jgi:hypothetical protein
LPDNLPSHKWLGYYRMMSLLTELASFTPPFLQMCQSYGLRRLRILRATKNSNAHCPKRPSQNDVGGGVRPNGTTVKPSVLSQNQTARFHFLPRV